ncbi:MULTISPECIES: spore germination protein [Bacillales]|uniref:Spore germination protein n=2 Tax=Brevibacillus TaxID=55080 RepID=A0A2Z4MKY5_BREBE|nr:MULTISPECIES: spore germination protein [Bacillales]MCE0449730.1 spore germination protein [Brevibacillus sp. AF8]MCM3143283.1 spore germination protein [Brevibacillus sp. MER 51]MED1916161.1 spore germination protein [Bacillus thuringiensis]AWX57138.1 spore germination protein [Brevibacillus brevis]EJL31065.1 Spore germination protein gerPA/gerPF [Brevibacillus sp. BC25]
MPSVIGAVNINNNSGTVNFGDTLNISPKTAAKTFSGSGGGNTGNVVNTLNGVNATNTLDPNVVDQPMFGNI